MRSFLIFLFSALALLQPIFAQDCLVHTGTYQGKNIYIQNPFASNGVGFSVKEVAVNGVAITTNFASSAFIIDLEKQGFKKGDSISVHIYHEGNSEPKFINSQVLLPKKLCKIQEIRVEQDSVLKFCANNYVENTDLIIEQFRWNKWIKLGEVKTNTQLKNDCFEFNLDLHSGGNLIRVSQYNSLGVNYISDSITIESKSPKIHLANTKGKNIILTGETRYEIFNTFGLLVKRGYGSVPDLKLLEPGLYYINYDNTTGDVWNKTFY